MDFFIFYVKFNLTVVHDHFPLLFFHGTFFSTFFVPPGNYFRFLDFEPGTLVDPENGSQNAAKALCTTKIQPEP